MTRFCTFIRDDREDDTPEAMTEGEWANGGRAILDNADEYVWQEAPDKETAIARHAAAMLMWRARSGCRHRTGHLPAGGDLAAPMQPISPLRFVTLMADPPWPYNNTEGPRAAPDHRPNSWDKPTGAVGSALRYGSMSMAELKAMPVREIVADNAHLYLWLTNSFLVEAHDLARAWGFEPKTMITWGKMKPNGTPSGATEHILFAVRGRGRLIGPPAPTLVLSPRLAHSVKPEWAYALAEQQSPSPRAELFARQKRLGWSSWGNQVPCDFWASALAEPAN